MQPNQISPQIREAFLNYFLSAWNNWSYHEKPHSFWLREYEWLSAPQHIPALTWTKRVWLMNENGLEEKNQIDWRRFEILLRDFAIKPFHRRVHEVAVGYFAPTSRDGVFYYETAWGGTWGMGATCSFNENGVMTNGQVLWRS